MLDGWLWCRVVQSAPERTVSTHTLHLISAFSFPLSSFLLLSFDPSVERDTWPGERSIMADNIPTLATPHLCPDHTTTTMLSTSYSNYQKEESKIRKEKSKRLKNDEIKILKKEEIHLWWRMNCVMNFPKPHLYDLNLILNINKIHQKRRGEKVYEYK